jgi:hypothetical protein
MTNFVIGFAPLQKDGAWRAPQRALDLLSLAGYFGFLDVGEINGGDSRNSGHLLKEGGED